MDNQTSDNSEHSPDGMSQAIFRLCASIDRRLTDVDTFNLHERISISDLDPDWGYPDDSDDDADSNEQCVEDSAHVSHYGFFASRSRRGCSNADKLMQVFQFILSKNYPFKEIIFVDDPWMEITDAHIRLMRYHYAELESFCLYDLNISSEVLSDFFQGRRSLTEITLRRCSQVDDDVVRTIADHCPKLQSLNITREKDSVRPCRVSDEAISYLAEKSPDLALIYLKRRGVSDVAVNKLAEFCSMLKVIDLVDCNEITDEGIKALTTSCQSLTKISLGASEDNVAKLTRRSLEAIADSNIQILELGIFADIGSDQRNQSRQIFSEFIQKANTLIAINMNFEHYDLGFTSIIHFNKPQQIEISYSDEAPLDQDQILNIVSEEAENQSMPCPFSH